MPDLVEFNVGGHLYTTTFETIAYDKSSLLYAWYIEHKTSAHMTRDKNGAYFIDRDPHCFAIILNYLRLQRSRQLWEVCLPKDPDRLAMLTQEAEYFRLPLLRDQAIALLHNCTEQGNQSSYVNEVLSKSTSFPQGFDLGQLNLKD